MHFSIFKIDVLGTPKSGSFGKALVLLSIHPGLSPGDPSHSKKKKNRRKFDDPGQRFQKSPKRYLVALSANCSYPLSFFFFSFCVFVLSFCFCFILVSTH